MASITITLTESCATGGHITLEMTGASTDTWKTHVEDVTGPISQEDKKAFTRTLVRLGKIGRTNAQLRTLFQAGVTVTV